MWTPWRRHGASFQPSSTSRPFAVGIGIALGLCEVELPALRWDNVDPESATLRVVDTVQRLGKRCGASSQLRSCCLASGAPEGTRTPNLLIRSQMLYPLSYGRVA